MLCNFRKLCKVLYIFLQDDELAVQCENFNHMKEQLLEKQQELLQLRRDMDIQQMDFLRVNKECDMSKAELKEVMQALEELALSFDEKKSEVEKKLAEIDQLQEENIKNRVKSYLVISTRL